MELEAWVFLRFAGVGVSLVHVLGLRFPGCRDLPDKWPDWKWILSTGAVV